MLKLKDQQELLRISEQHRQDQLKKQNQAQILQQQIRENQVKNRFKDVMSDHERNFNHRDI